MEYALPLLLLLFSHQVMSDSEIPWTYSPPGSSVHGIFHAGILEWVAISFSRGSSPPRDWIWVSCVANRFFVTEPPVKSHTLPVLVLLWKEGFLSSFKKIYSFIYWRIITLQNFVDFCQTSAWISHRYTYISSLLNLPPIPSPSHPSRLIQSPCLSFLSHTANSCWLSILHMVM